MRFTVERSRWIRGADSYVRCATSNEPSYLLNDACLLRTRDNKMCCLGFVCNQLGVSETALSDVGGPDELPPEIIGSGRLDILVRGYEKCTDLTAYAMEINDDVTISDTDREAALTKLFADHGLEMEFVP